MNKKIEVAKRMVSGSKKDITQYEKEIIPGRISSYLVGMLHYEYRSLAANQFLLDGLVKGFRERLKLSVGFRLDELSVFSKDNPCSGIIFLPSILDALACGEFSMAKELVEGSKRKVGKRKPSNFYSCLYFFIDILLTNSEILKDKNIRNPALEYLEKVIKHHQTKQKSFAGLPLMIKAILDRDSQEFQSSLDVFLVGYKKFITKSVYDGLGYFICLWGLGLANLALALGMSVSVDHEYLPRELLLDPEDAQAAYRVLFSK
jgi:hypothetical protein